MKSGSPATLYLFFRHFQGLEVISYNPEFLLQFDNLGVTMFCPFFGTLEVGLHHGQLTRNLIIQKGGYSKLG